MAVTIDGSAGVTTNAGGSVNPSTTIDGINYSCRAWVNFNGTGTVAIRGSGNVTSITDNGAGDYSVVYTTAMSDANYCVVTNAGTYASTISGVACPFRNGATGAYVAPTTAEVRVNTFPLNSTTATDNQAVTVSVFR